MAIDAKALADKLAPPVRQARGHVSAALLRMFRGLPAKKLEQFYFQLATMLSAGVSIRESLHTLAGQHQGRAARIFAELAEEVQAGGELSPVLFRRPEVFGHFAPAMLRAAEKTGGLDQSLSLVAKTMERFRRIRSQVITALFYPAVLLHLGLAIWNVPLLFTLGLARYLEALAMALVPVYLGLVVLWFVFQVLRDWTPFGELILSMWMFGGVSKKSGLARFARALSALYESGVSLPLAVEISADMPRNPAIRRSLKDALPVLMGGNSLEAALGSCRHVTPMVRNMVDVGERSGRLSLALEKIADFYEDEAEAAIQRMAKIIPVFIYVGLLVAFGYKIVDFWISRYRPFL